MNDSKLTKYEIVRLLGTRAIQLAHGAPPMVDIDGLKDPLAIAEKELSEKRIPIVIIRNLPNGKKIEVDPN